MLLLKAGNNDGSRRQNWGPSARAHEQSEGMYELRILDQVVSHTIHSSDAISVAELQQAKPQHKDPILGCSHDFYKLYLAAGVTSYSSTAILYEN